MASLGESEQAVETEVSTIKEAYPNKCRVIKDGGQFSHILTVQPGDMDATIKLQLPKTYPQAAPVVILRSESLTPEVLSDVTDSINMTSGTMTTGLPMIQKLIDEATHQLRAVGLRPGKAIKINQDTDLCGNKKRVQKKKNKSNKKKKDDEEDEDKKLPPMKTATDVVNRIIWDDTLEKDDFIVGYFDRFRGLLEKSFSAFSWEDLASVDYDVLAVPKHRIQYFKYKDEKVWDKSRRIDNVFGSAKGTKTIDVVIKEIEAANSVEHMQTTQSKVDATLKDVSDGSSFSDEYDDAEDDDDDDGIMVTIGANAGIGVSTTRANVVTSSENVTPGPEGAEGGVYNPYWKDKLRPNHFICVRLTDAAILEKAVEVQDHLMDQEPVLAECCIPGASLHVTLCTLGLDTAQQLQMCIDSLKKVESELAAALPSSPLCLRGVSHFYNRVVYAQVQHGHDFLDFCDVLKRLLREAGVALRDGYDFVPHATLMKVTRPVARERGSKNIDPKIYERFKNTDFGKQRIESIYLCSMDRDRRSDGFYLTPLELHFKS